MTNIQSLGRVLRSSLVVRGFVTSAIASAVVYAAITMIGSAIQAHNRSVVHQEFCLNHGYSDYKETRSFDNHEFWCMDIASHPINPKTLGWKENAE